MCWTLGHVLTVCKVIAQREFMSVPMPCGRESRFLEKWHVTMWKGLWCHFKGSCAHCQLLAHHFTHASLSHRRVCDVWTEGFSQLQLILKMWYKKGRDASKSSSHSYFFHTGISFVTAFRILEIHIFYNLHLLFWHYLEILWLFIFLVFYTFPHLVHTHSSDARKRRVYPCGRSSCANQ